MAGQILNLWTSREALSLVFTVAPDDWKGHNKYGNGEINTATHKNPSPGNLPGPGIKPRSLAFQVDSLPTEPPGKMLEGAEKKGLSGRWEK